MSEIRIDVKAAIEQAKKGLDDLADNLVKDIQVAVGQLSQNVEAEAIRLAAEKLHGTYQQYANSIKREQIGDNTWVIYLDDSDNDFINKLETGSGPFDMKPGFLNSPKAKQGKKGPYMDVPIDQKPFSKMGGTQKVTDYRSAVEKAIKDSKVESTIEAYNQDSAGLAKYGDVERYSGISDPRAQGLVKITPPGSKQGTYLLFRRVSKNSPNSSWIHPGFPGVNIFENELKQYAEKELANILSKILG